MVVYRLFPEELAAVLNLHELVVRRCGGLANDLGHFVCFQRYLALCEHVRALRANVNDVPRPLRHDEESRKPAKI